LLLAANGEGLTNCIKSPGGGAIHAALVTSHIPLL
jgi:hypothetical protein